MSRVVALLTAIALFAMPVRAQAPERSYRLGVIAPSALAIERFKTAAAAELGKHGIVEGRNLTIEARYGPPHQLGSLARELVQTKPDVILAASVVAIRAVKGATSTVPIVMSFSGDDPVAAGFAASLARPGSNITGIFMLSEELEGKRLQLLHDVVPAAKVIAVLAAPPPRHERSIAQVRAVAAGIGVDIALFHVGAADEYALAFTAMRNAGAHALLILASPEFERDTPVLSRLAAEARLPTMCHWPHHIRAGCLLGYGARLETLERRAIEYARRIMKGAVPAEIPIEQPTHFELTINLKVARELDLRMSPGVLARAGEVIE